MTMLYSRFYLLGAQNVTFTLLSMDDHSNTNDRWSLITLLFISHAVLSGNECLLLGVILTVLHLRLEAGFEIVWHVYRVNIRPVEIYSTPACP